MNTERLIAFTQLLVRTPSLSGQEKNVVELILAEMRDLGFDRVWANANGSAIGVIQGARPGKTILLDAHCDHVGIAAGSKWTRYPFGAQIANGFIYGRATADMKGALAAMLYGAASVDRARIAGQIVVSATVLEEVMEGVSLRTVMDEVKPDFVVIGEATELNLNRGGRGRAEIHLETLGKPAHSSSPQLGVNAVLAMMQAINAIEQTPVAGDELLGDALMVLTDIISDPYPGYSVIPSRCRVTYDRRLLPGETPESVLSALPVAAKIAQGEHATYTGQTLRGAKFFPAWIFPEDHSLVQNALRGLRDAGLNPRIGAYRFCTNAAYSAGIARVPTIGFGPAREGDAHVVDERIGIDDLIAAARGYRGIIQATLGESS
jgi:putative selenium metabolism hydrolase